MSNITREEVLKLAALARLEISEEEIERYQQEISEILTYVEVLNSADTDNVEPTYQVSGLQNVWRADEVVDYGTNQEELLKNAPRKDGDSFKVGRMVG